MTEDEYTLSIMQKIFPEKSILDLLQSIQDSKEREQAKACHERHAELQFSSWDSNANYIGGI